MAERIDTTHLLLVQVRPSAFIPDTWVVVANLPEQRRIADAPTEAAALAIAEAYTQAAIGMIKRSRLLKYWQPTRERVG